MFIAICTLFALALTGTEAQDYATGIQIFTATAETPTCTKAGVICSSDCSTLLLCMGNNPTPLDQLVCSAPNQYCVNSACTTKPSAECTTAPDFTCTSDGIFPEPTDCTRYRACDAGVSSLFQCPAGYVFNSERNICQRGTTPCTKIDCSSAPKNSLIVYASNKQFYALCAFDAGTIRTLLFRCGESQIFDTTTNTCRLRCTAKGYFQNPESCSEYYYCSSATAIPSAMLICPSNYVFDGTRCNMDARTCKLPPKTTTTTTPTPSTDQAVTDSSTGAVTESSTQTPTDPKTVEQIIQSILQQIEQLKQQLSVSDIIFQQLAPVITDRCRQVCGPFLLP